eukprot:tig00000093_g3575.t1
MAAVPAMVVTTTAEGGGSDAPFAEPQASGTASAGPPQSTATQGDRPPRPLKIHISLETFDDRNPNSVNITSPRSKEACLRQGIEPTELLYRPIESFAERGLAPALQRRRYDHYEIRRQAKLQLVKQERLLIMQEAEEQEAEEAREPEEEPLALPAPPARAPPPAPAPAPAASSASPPPAAGAGDGMHSYRSGRGSVKSHKSGASGTASVADSAFIAREKDFLERLQRRQQKEVEAMVAYEKHLAELREAQRKRDEEKRRQEEELARDRARRQKEWEEKRRERDLQKAKEAEEEQIRRQILAQEKYEQERKEAEKRRAEEERRRREARKAEEEKARAADEAKRKAEAAALAQRREAEARRREMEEKEERRRQAIEAAKQRRAAEAGEKRAEAEARLFDVKAAVDETLRSQREAIERKQAEMEWRRQQQEAARRLESEERRKASDKSRQVEEAVARAAELERERKAELVAREQKTHERLRQLAVEKEAEARAQRRDLEAKERQRREKLEAAKRREAERKATIVRAIEEVEGVLDKARLQQRKSAEFRTEDRRLRMIEKAENVERMKRIEAYKREKALEKIRREEERVAALREKQAEMLNQRKRFREANALIRQQLTEAVEKLRANKKLENAPEELAKVLAVARRGPDSPRSSSASPSASPPPRPATASSAAPGPSSSSSAPATSVASAPPTAPAPGGKPRRPLIPEDAEEEGEPAAAAERAQSPPRRSQSDPALRSPAGGPGASSGAASMRGPRPRPEEATPASPRDPRLLQAGGGSPGPSPKREPVRRYGSGSQAPQATGPGAGDGPTLNPFFTQRKPLEKASGPAPRPPSGLAGLRRGAQLGVHRMPRRAGRRGHAGGADGGDGGLGGIQGAVRGVRAAGRAPLTGGQARAYLASTGAVGSGLFGGRKVDLDTRIRNQIEETRRLQNEQLLALLEEEQAAETEREMMLASVRDPAERRRLERIFGVERAQASERIISTTIAHERLLQEKLDLLK